MSEDLFGNRHDISRVLFVDGKDKRFGQAVKVRFSSRLLVEFVINDFLVRFEYEFNLSGIDDTFVEFLFGYCALASILTSFTCPVYFVSTLTLAPSLMAPPFSVTEVLIR